MTVLVLAGCTPGPSDEEVLAEARSAWDAYEERLNAFAADPSSASLEQLLGVATQPVAEDHLATFETLAENGARTDGARTTTAFEALDLSEAPDSVTVGVCQDLSDLRYLDEQGQEVEVDVAPHEAATITLTRSGERFLVSADSLYSGAAEDDPCSS